MTDKFIIHDRCKYVCYVQLYVTTYNMYIWIVMDIGRIWFRDVV